MMISTKLEALRSLFAQHAQVALLSSADDDIDTVCMEQNHLAKLYAQAYRQSYREILWLDARNRALLRLTSLHACQRLGLIPKPDEDNLASATPANISNGRIIDPCQLLQDWLQQTQLTVLCIVENASEPLRLAIASPSALHVLYCSSSQKWPACAIYSVDEANKSKRGASKHAWNSANLAATWAKLSAASQALLTSCAYLGPLPLPMSCLPLCCAPANAEKPVPPAANAQPGCDPQMLLLLQLTELMQCRFAKRAEWRDVHGNSWPCLQIAPACQAWLRKNGKLEDASYTMALLQSAFANGAQVAAYLPLLHQHLEYFLIYSHSSPKQTALLLLQLEAHYQQQAHESEALLRRVLQLLPLNNLLEYSDEYFECCNLLAQNLKQQGRLDEAQELLIASLQIARQVIGEWAVQTCIFMSNLGRLLAQRGQHLAALELEQQAMQGLRRSLPDKHPHVQAVMRNLAHSLHQIPLDAKAESLLQQLVDIQLRLFGECDQHSQALMDQLAGHFFEQHKLHKAVHWMARVLAVRKQLFGARHAETSIAAYELLCLYCEREEGELALRIFEEHLAWLQKANPAQLHEQQREIRELLQDFPPNSVHEAPLAGANAPPVPHILH